MSVYSQTVREHWEKYRPRELAQMQDPEGFFRDKGREIQVAILEAEQALEEALEPEQDYQARVGQLNQIRATAEQQVLAELLPPPEEEPELPPLSPEMQELLAIRDELNEL